MVIFELHAEHGVGEKLHHLSAHFEQFFLRQTIPLASKRITGKSRRLNAWTGKREARGS
jgi:hypothetical protein